MGIHDTIVGFDDLLTNLRALGYRARAASGDERARLGASDRHCITLEGHAVDMISVRLEGGVGLRDNLRHRAGRVSLGWLPVSSRTVLPIRTHYIFRCDPREESGNLSARLELECEGIFKRRAVAAYWSGGRLAGVLNAEPRSVARLLGLVGPTETLRIKPDVAAGCVRIVHGTVRVLDYSLFKEGLVSFQQDLAPRELLLAIEGLAEQVRRYLRQCGGCQTGQDD